MSWTKHFTPVKTDGTSSLLSQSQRATPSRTNYSSFLPDVYSGHPNRLERYGQYAVMDLDSELNAGFDILAEFCTQLNDENGTPFNIFFKDQATSTEIKLLKKYLQQWSKLNKFSTRIFKIVRNTFKFGDCFFVRDPETLAWMYVDPAKVDKIIVNESEGKVPEQYIIRDLNINFQSLAATQITPTVTTPGAGGGSNAGIQRGMVGAPTAPSGSRFSTGQNQVAIAAKHVVHLSLSEGLDDNFPFGNSLMETCFKVYKQKELLEDAIIIYRIQRAPERRVFYIDVGNMPSHLAMSFVERIKNEVNQRRIPSSTGGGQSVIDSGFNAMGVGEDFYFPTTAEGRGSKIEVLPGGCFAMDTNVSLIDGRELSIREIEQELKNVKELWTYSCNPKTGAIVPGLISWAGVTQKTAKVLKLTLSNGKEIICTPCHKFPQFNSEFKCASDFVVGDSLIPLYRKISTLEQSGVDIEQYFDNHTQTWNSTYKLVNDYLENSNVKYEISTNISETDHCYVTNIEYLDEEIEVGTLTIDANEIYHDYHTFALSCGVMTKNSNLGEISDLLFFTQKLMRALRIPSSYLPTGADDSSGSFSDGRVGTAYIQELRFNKYCERLQSLIQEQFDTEFKSYLFSKGINIDANLFDLKFNPPQNFAAYRQAEMDGSRVNVYGAVAEVPHLSKRFALKRFLGLTTEEIAENERLWREENVNDTGGLLSAQAELRSLGVTAGGISSDMDTMGSADLGPEDMEGGSMEPAPEAAPAAPPPM